MNSLWVNLAVAGALTVSALGVVVPILPGTLLALVALLGWAIVTGGTTAWVAFSVMLIILGVGQVLKYLLPHRSLSAAGVPGRSIVIGGLAAIAGFFVIPVVGLIVGFMGGLYVAEHVRQGSGPAARASTWVAMKATGFSILIELGALLAAASVWTAAVISLT